MPIVRMVLTVLVLSGTPPAALASTREADACNAFGLRIQPLLASPNDNLVFSPWSLFQALALVQSGAAGSTAKEMAAALGLEPGFDLCAFRRGAASPADTTRGTVFRSMNTVWTAIPARPAFLERARTCFGAEVDRLRSVEQVNRRLGEQTGGRIRNLLPEGEVDMLTRVIVTNTVHFKGRWRDAFPLSGSDPRPFHGSRGRTQNVPTMKRTMEIPYHKGPDLALIQLPYSEGAMDMVVVLPDARNGLADVERTLDAAWLQSWLASASWTNVEVQLPRFSLSFSDEMGGRLRRIGMDLAFGCDADFSAMAEERIFLSKVFHAATIDVDEKGTEATAATIVQMKGWSQVRKAEVPVRFHADHPFLFALRDTSTGAFLFLGRVVAPWN